MLLILVLSLDILVDHFFIQRFVMTHPLLFFANADVHVYHTLQTYSSVDICTVEVDSTRRPEV